MFYLMAHSTHFYLLLYDVGYMVEDRTDERRNLLLSFHMILFSD